LVAVGVDVDEVVEAPQPPSIRAKSTKITIRRDFFIRVSFIYKNKAGYKDPPMNRNEETVLA
jgi:hypothetical protein